MPSIERAGMSLREAADEMQRCADRLYDVPGLADIHDAIDLWVHAVLVIDEQLQAIKNAAKRGGDDAES